ncbi:MAG: hypothetical protein K0R28_440 [Paenibacillus sp.]|nr:hypothetical protein [Paenibacillus sp.]
MNRIIGFSKSRLLIVAVMISMLVNVIGPALAEGREPTSPGLSMLARPVSGVGGAAEEETVPGSHRFDLAAPNVANAVYGTVYANVVPAPVLDPLPAYTRDDRFEIRGQAAPGAIVAVSFARNGGELKEAGRATAEQGSGRFAVPFETDHEGEYAFTASASLNGQNSGASLPVLIGIDWSVPREVENLDWRLAAYNKAVISWDPPVAEDEGGNYADDPTVKTYRIFDSEGSLLEETEQQEYATGILEEKLSYVFKIRAVDLAGNMSEGSEITVAASPKQETKLDDLDAGLGGHRVVVSGDGSKAAYINKDRSAPPSRMRHLYVVDTFTKEMQVASVTKDGRLPDRDIEQFALNGSGSIAVFSSNAGNLLAAPEHASGTLLYAYDSVNQKMELLSEPDKYVSYPSISRDGNWVAYGEDDRIYLYDRTGKTRKLVSETTDGQPENGNSDKAVMSADGKFIAFVSSSTNLKGGSAAPGFTIYVYDVAASRIVRHFAYHASNLDINEDGSFIAYTSYVGSYKQLFFIDVANGSVKDLNEGRPPEEVKTRNYNNVSISDDGKTVFADYLHYTVSKTRAGSERYDVETGSVESVGNPALRLTYGVMDGTGDRFAYVQESSVYAYCRANCERPDPGDAIAYVKWTAPVSSRAGDQLLPDTVMTITANGRPGLSVEAVIAYKQLVFGNPSQQEEKQIAIPLAEVPGNPGVYRNEFATGAGVAEISSITARLADGSSAKQAEQTPVKIAGKLEMDIQSDRMSVLDGTQLIVRRPARNPITIPISGTQTHYEVYLASAEDYTLVWQNRDGTVTLAQHNGIAINNARTTELLLTPVLTATLAVKISGFDNGDVSVRVLVKDKAGNVLANVPAVDGEAVVERKAGDELIVSVITPEGYTAKPESQSIVMQLGMNECMFVLSEAADGIASATIDFAKTIPERFGARLPVMDSAANVRVVAEPGLSLKAKVVYRQWKGGTEPERTERIVDLAETMPGEYTAPFVMQEGIARVDSLMLQVGEVWSRKEFPIGKNVAGRIKVSVDNPKAEGWKRILAQATLHAGYFGHNRLYSETVRLESDKFEYTFDVPYVQAAYQMHLSSKDQALRPVSHMAEVPRYGQTANVAFSPKYRAAWNGKVTDEGGEKLPVTYTIRDESDRIVENGSVWGEFSALIEAVPGERLQLKLSSSNIQYYSKNAELIVDEPEESASFVLQRKPVAGLVGRVYSKDNKPAANAYVTATLLQDGLSKTYYARSDQDGAYAIQMPTGTVQLRASGRAEIGYLSALATVYVPETGNTTADLKLNDYGSIDLNLYTRYTGAGWEGPVAIDWRSAMQMGIQSSSMIMEYGDPMKVKAVVGDTVQICVYGLESDLPNTCRKATLGEDNTATVEMRIENARAQASVAQFVKPDGTESRRNAFKLYRLPDHDHVKNGYFIQGRPYTLSLPVAGEYRMVVEGDGGHKATVDFSVSSDSTMELGIIRLHPPGKFDASAGNGLGLSSERAVASGTLTARVQYANNGVPRGEARNARLILEYPAAFRAAQGTLIVNGKAVESEVQGQSLIIPLGDLAAGTSGSAQVQFRIGDLGANPDTAITAKIRYRDETAEREEIIGTAIVRLMPVTLRAPKLVSKPQFKLSGVAPAGAEVTVYDGTEALGRTTASPLGTWNLPAELRNTEESKHRIRAETEFAGNRISGDEAIVIYDPNDAGLDEVKMQQAGSRIQTFRPDDGVAVFPYVVEPGNPFTFTMKFRDPSRISNVRVQFGSSFAAGQWTGEVFTATMPMPLSIGPIEVTYDTKRLPWEPERDLRDPPSEEQVRDDLHPSLRNYAMESVVQPGSGGNPNNTAKIGAMMTDNIRADIQYSVSKISNYTPSAQELQKAQASGIPVYGMKMSHSLSGSKGSISFEAVIPEEALQKDEGIAAAFGLISRAWSPAGKSMDVAALSVPQQAAGSMAKVTMTIGLDLLKGNAEELWKAFDKFWNAKTIAGQSEIFDRVNKDLQWAQSLCDPDLIRYYSDWATEIGNDIMINETIKWGLSVVALVVAAPTFGLGTVGLWGVQYIAEQFLNDAVDYKLNALEDAMRKVKCLPKPPKHPQADPKFIWDPSGYVYEGIPDNRLEGVTATAMEQDPATKAWNVWDAEWYGQSNPLVTDRQGKYAWDVPEGKWKVRYEKDGYETGYSDELDVPPPQLEVNVPLVSYLPPAVRGVSAEPGGAKMNVSFTKPIAAESLHNGVVEVSGGLGENVTGAVYAVSPVVADGKSLSMAIEFKPDRPLTADAVYKVKVSGQILSYAGAAMGTDFEQQVTVAAKDAIPPNNVSELNAGMFGPNATLSWTDPADTDLSHARVRYKKASDTSFGPPLEVKKGTQWADIASLEEDESYDFLVTSVDESGNESAGVRRSWTAAADEPDLTAPSAVRELNAVAASQGQLHATWIDPTAPDLAKLRIGWIAENGNAPAQSFELSKGVQAYSIKGLSDSTAYLISIVAIDDAGNESDAATVTVRTLEASPDTSGGGAGGKGWPVPDRAQSPADGEWVIGKEGGEFEAFGGRLRLALAAGTFEDKTKLTAKELPVGAGAWPERFYALSRSYLLDAGQAEPRQPMKLTLQYDLALHKGTDARRLCIYIKDASSPSGWTCLGGQLDEESRTIEASIEHFGEYAVLLYDHPFADLAAHWSQTDVNVLVSRHIVDGVSGEHFEPDRPITRAEITKLLVELVAKPRSGGSADPGMKPPGFEDVAAGAWYYRYVAAAHELRIVEGSDGRFRPNDPITREEMAVMLDRADALIGANAQDDSGRSALGGFRDAEQISEWAKKAMADAVAGGLIQGMGDRELQPKATATRAQAAVVILRVMEKAGMIGK